MAEREVARCKEVCEKLTMAYTTAIDHERPQAEIRMLYESLVRAKYDADSARAIHKSYRNEMKSYKKIE